MATPQKTPLPPFDAPEAVMQAAGAWLARRDRGFTPAEAREFAGWSQAHPSHAAAVAQLSRTMLAFDGLRDLAPAIAHAGEPDPDAFAPPRPRRGWFYPSLVAAGIAAALALVFWQRSPGPAAAAWHYATTATAYQRTLLPDGSALELNADSAIEIDYTAAERTVRLTRGEANFQVAKNPARPFVVHAGGVAFRAVGTAFNVRLNPGDVEMLVTEGKVRVEDPAAPITSALSSSAPATVGTSPLSAAPLLVAGQKIVVPSARTRAPTVAALSTDEIDRAVAWQQRVVEFKKTPLSDIVTEFNRQNRPQIVIADPTLDTLRVGGNFRLDQPEAFVRLLETSFGIAAEQSGETYTLRKAP